jgi:SpoVK/Ycf46/Vps4 family AAA+-type ATPase
MQLLEGCQKGLLFEIIKRIMIPVLDYESRLILFQNLLKNQKVNLSKKDYQKISQITDGYSGSDIKSLCQETSLLPIRELGIFIQFIF